MLSYETLSTFLMFLSFSFFPMFQFFASDDRIKSVRKMIMASTVEQRQAALDLLLPYQRSDFEGIFRAMDGIVSIFCTTYHINL